VPFAGGNGIVADLVAERVDAAFLALPLALRHLGHEKLHALGITSARRFETLPDLPTLTQAGTPLVFESWFAVFGSAHLPAALNRRVQMAIRAYRSEEAARSELRMIGLVPSSATQAQLALRIEAEQVRLNRLGR
jgi:tripartite-type tricarboxylate transporter receptor subunit TctC